jgi:galactosamine-6-phosphate isomerase
MMQIVRCKDYKEMSTLAADLIQEELKKKPELLLCVPTGNSPAGLYEALVARSIASPELFAQLRIIKLDEWGGVPENHPHTCEFFIKNKLIGPLNISPERYLTFRSDPEDPEGECQLVRAILKEEGPIDLCILGLGQNGHLGLNEPGASLEPYCHVAELSERSLEHDMIASLELKPSYGLTLGMQEILSSRKIILLVTGEGKKEMYSKLMERKITTDHPASFLWTHGNVSCFLDKKTMT